MTVKTVNLDDLLGVYHHRRLQYLNREDTDLQILQNLFADLGNLINAPVPKPLSVSEPTTSQPQEPFAWGDVWLPDNSGEWIMNTGVKPDLYEETRIEVLYAYEVDDRYYEYDCCEYAGDVDWSILNSPGDVVAYKIVKWS